MKEALYRSKHPQAVFTRVSFDAVDKLGSSYVGRKVANFVAIARAGVRAGRNVDVDGFVVRRAERHAIAAAPAPSQAGPYLNRLSDLLWTLARWQEGESLPVRSVTD